MGLLQVLLPPSCAGCGRYGAVLCRVCHGRIRPAGRESDRFLAADAGIVLGDAMEVAVAAFAHGGPLRKALASLKYGGAAAVVRPLALRAVPRLASLADLMPGATLVPVPVHVDRLRQRGYNQARLLALELARAGELRVVDVLERRRPTIQQHRLDRAARLRNLREAFAVRAGHDVPEAVILVDDILTTSATLEACAAVLRDAGARRVLGFAIAREV